MKRGVLLSLAIASLGFVSCDVDSDTFPLKNPSEPTDSVSCEVGAFDSIPGTSLCEEDLAEFEAVTEMQFLEITSGSVYAQNIEYICYREGDEVCYEQLFSSYDAYNVFSQLDGRPGLFVSFQEDFATVQYESLADGSGDVVHEYHSYLFDGGAQTLASNCINGYAAEGECYKLVYADADYIVLENTLSERAKAVFALDDDKPYFVREVLIRYAGKLKEPAVIRDYR